MDIWVSDIEDRKTTNDMIRCFISLLHCLNVLIRANSFVDILDIPNSGIISHLRSIRRSVSAPSNSGKRPGDCLVYHLKEFIRLNHFHTSCSCG